MEADDGARDSDDESDAAGWVLPQSDDDAHASNDEWRVADDAEWREAAPGDKGDVVIRRQYPYMALTVWSSEGFGEAGWRGDVERWRRYFAAGAGYVQGDTAIKYADGSYTFHGRADEVINVGGNRIGTAEIEGALLASCPEGGLAGGRSLQACAVVGRPHKSMGEAPCAFLVLGAAPPAASGSDGGGGGGGLGRMAAIGGLTVGIIALADDGGATPVSPVNP